MVTWRGPTRIDRVVVRDGNGVIGDGAADVLAASSFHVHTPGEDANLDELVDTLRSIVRSVIGWRPVQRAEPTDRSTRSPG